MWFIYIYSDTERANESLDELRNSLEAVSLRPGYVGSADGKSQLTRTVHPRILTWEDGRMQPPEDSKAAVQLRNLLSTHTKVAVLYMFISQAFFSAGTIALWIIP